MKRLAYVGASLLLAMSVATACSDDKDGKDTAKSASKEDFCAQIEGFDKVDDEDAFNDFKDELKDVGTPEEIDGDAREGFEILVDLDWDDAQDGDSVPKEDQEKVVAFLTEATELCGTGMGATPSEAPSE